jgi:hypothetical protein
MWEMLCRERDLQRKRRENERCRNNVVCVELYSGAKMVNERLENETCEIEKSRVHGIGLFIIPDSYGNFMPLLQLA